MVIHGCSLDTPAWQPEFQGRKSETADLDPRSISRQLCTSSNLTSRSPIEPATWLPTPLPSRGVRPTRWIDPQRQFPRSQSLTPAAEATREEMRDARLPIAYRDSCAHLLIPLNKCRRDTWYAPWKCTVSFLLGCAVAAAPPTPTIPPRTKRSQPRDG